MPENNLNLGTRAWCCFKVVLLCTSTGPSLFPSWQTLVTTAIHQGKINMMHAVCHPQASRHIIHWFNGIVGIDDPVLVEALYKYHREKLVNNGIISQRLKAEYGINMAYAPISYITYISNQLVHSAQQPSKDDERLSVFMVVEWQWKLAARVSA